MLEAGQVPSAGRAGHDTSASRSRWQSGCHSGDEEGSASRSRWQSGCHSGDEEGSASRSR